MAYKQKINPRTGKFDLVVGGGDGGKTEVTSVDKTVTVKPTTTGVDLSVKNRVLLVDDEKGSYVPVPATVKFFSEGNLIEVTDDNGNSHIIGHAVFGDDFNNDFASGCKQIQSDWAQKDDTQVDFIKNKPDIKQTIVSSGTSNIDIPSIQSVIDYVEQEKGKLRVIRVSNAKTTPKRFVQVTSNDTGYYKLTAMVMGASGNPDYFGLVEIAFGYNRPGSNPNFCYAYWVAFSPGKPENQMYKQSPVFNIWVSGDKKTMIVGAKCPSDTYQTLELHIMTEETAYGTSVYGKNSTADIISNDFLSTATQVEIVHLTVPAREEVITYEINSTKAIIMTVDEIKNLRELRIIATATSGEGLVMFPSDASIEIGKTIRVVTVTDGMNVELESNSATLVAGRYSYTSEIVWNGTKWEKCNNL